MYRQYLSQKKISLAEISNCCLFVYYVSDKIELSNNTLEAHCTLDVLSCRTIQAG